MIGLNAFFTYARARQTILLKRRAGNPCPWTDDPVFQNHKFANVFREDDKTTVWFRTHVRNPMRDDPSVLLATVLFRWFNRIDMGEVIFYQPNLDGRTPWQEFLTTGKMGNIRGALMAVFPNGPYTSGAYNTVPVTAGTDKLNAIAHFCEEFHRHSDWLNYAFSMLDNPIRYLESFSTWLQQSDGQGPRTAYEVACDLYHTDILKGARDANTWAAASPGARRGLNRIHGRRRMGANPRPWDGRIATARALEEMQILLEASRSEKHWPENWPKWDMCTVEHTLSQFDLYNRLTNGETR